MGKQTLEGILHFYSETGTEGGYWAFQDSQYISLNTTRYSCKKCHLYWDKKINPSVPTYKNRSAKEKKSNKERKSKKDKHLSNIYLPDYCSPRDHQFELVSKQDWSYEGLHILKDGDGLTIYDPSNKDRKLWSGVIALQQYKLFTQHADGWWIHADQKGIEREVWAKYFFGQYPARLVPSKESSNRRA